MTPVMIMAMATITTIKKPIHMKKIFMTTCLLVLAVTAWGQTVNNTSSTAAGSSALAPTAVPDSSSTGQPAGAAAQPVVPAYKAMVEKAADEAKEQTVQLYKVSKDVNRMKLRDQILTKIDQILAEGLKYIAEQESAQKEAQALALVKIQTQRDSVDAVLREKKTELSRLEDAKANSAAIIQECDREISNLGNEIAAMKTKVGTINDFFAQYVRQCLELQMPSETQKKRAKEIVCNLPDEELKKLVKEKFGE